MIIWLDIDFKEICFTLEKNDWRKGKEFLNAIKDNIQDDHWITEVYYQTHYKTEMLWRIYVGSFDKFKEIFQQYYPAEYTTQKIKIKTDAFGRLLREWERKKANDANNKMRTVRT